MNTPRAFIPGWHPEFAQKARAEMAERGHFYSSAFFADDRPLPPAMSLAQFRKWTFDQGQVGSCFSNATAQAAQIDMVFGDPSRAFQVSRRLVWFEGRKLDGIVGSGGDGGSVTNALISLTDQAKGVGACHEELWPYRANHGWLETRPTAPVLADAGNTRFTEFAEASFGDGWKRQILNGRPVAIGIWWPSGWDMSVDSTGRATGIGRGGFGHALAVIGWVDDWDGHTWYQIENSHGPIYHPVPAAIAARIPGYVSAGATGINGEPDRTFDFWVRDDWMQTVLAKGDSEAVCIAGPEGFVKRDAIDPSTIMPLA